MRTKRPVKGLGTKWDLSNGGTEAVAVTCPKCGAEFLAACKHGKNMEPACQACLLLLARGNRPYVLPRLFSPRSSTGRARAF